jgi:catechol 2,3-dioxygenase
MMESFEEITDSLSGGIQPPRYRLPASARVGKAKLAVSKLDRSIAFYRDIIGLAVLEQTKTTAVLGIRDTSTVLVEMEAFPGVEPIGARSRLGLYHTASLLPNRVALSTFVQHLRAKRMQFGSGDHVYSEALYLVDPDGLSVEVYADRPRSTWKFEGKELVSGADPVRFNELPAVPPASWQSAPSGTTLGHMHFYVGDLEQASGFYHAGLGLTIMTWRYPGALFTSAGGYHHHVGLNVWAAGSPLAARTDARLMYWQLLLPDAEAVQMASASKQAAGYRAMTDEGDSVLFTDPWGITVALSIE